jgi:hypothetical protein
MYVSYTFFTSIISTTTPSGKINRPSHFASGDKCLLLGLVSKQPEASRPMQDWIIIIIYGGYSPGDHDIYKPIDFQHYTREKVSMEGNIV